MSLVGKEFQTDPSCDHHDTCTAYKRCEDVTIIQEEMADAQSSNNTNPLRQKLDEMECQHPALIKVSQKADKLLLITRTDA